MPDSYIEVAYGTGTADEALEPVDESEVWASIAAFGIAALLGAVATTLATGACYKAVADAYLGERPGWRTSLAYALRRLHSLLWVTVIYSIGVGIGLLLCILPGIFLAVAWVVAIPALLTEGRKGFGAVGRSYSLVKGRWWPSFALMLVGVLIAGFVSYAVQFLAFAPVFTGDGDDPVLLLAANAIGSTLAAALWTPLIAAFATVLYFDLRVRKEGFDLALLAERIGVAPDPARAPLAPQADPTAPYRPPPGWSPPSEPSSGEQPPYWPPPPGWKPGGDRGE
jgi:hypothetical protein